MKPVCHSQCPMSLVLVVESQAKISLSMLRAQSAYKYIILVTSSEELGFKDNIREDSSYGDGLGL